MGRYRARILTCGLVWLAVPALPAHAWHPAAGAVGTLGDYMEVLARDKTAVFYTACQLTDELKDVIVFRPGQPYGDFFTIKDQLPNGMAAAGILGQVNIENGTPEVVWTNDSSPGGKMLDSVVLYLVSQPFFVLPHDKLNVIFAEEAHRPC